MGNREINSQAFPQYHQSAYQTVVAGGLTKLEWIAALIYSHGELDVYDSAKAAVRLIEACGEISKASLELEKIQCSHSDSGVSTSTADTPK